MVVESETSMDIGVADTTVSSSLPRKASGAPSPMQTGSFNPPHWKTDGDAILLKEFPDPKPPTGKLRH